MVMGPGKCGFKTQNSSPWCGQEPFSDCKSTQNKQLYGSKNGSNLENVCFECAGSCFSVPQVNKTTILFAVLSVSILFPKALGRPAGLEFEAQVDQ